MTHTFYDAQGRAVETRTPGPDAGHDTIVYTVYNDAQHSSFQSVPFEIAHGSGWVDPASAIDPGTGTAPTGTGTFDDALGRTIAMQDPAYPSNGDGITCSATLSGTYTACTNYSLGSASGDSNVYATTTSIDPNNHVTVSFADVLGRTVSVQYDSGTNGGTLSVNELKSIQYNALGEPISVVVKDEAPPNGENVTTITTSAQYDSLGRMSKLVDPDRGTHTYTSDADGHLLSDVSGPSGQKRTLGYNDDLLGRVGCVQVGTPAINATGACTNGTTPLVQNTYDTTEIGTQGVNDFPVGRLTQSIATTSYPEGGSTTATQKMQYDTRGRVVMQHLLLTLPAAWNVSTALPTYKMALSYNDANQLTTTTTSTNPAGQGTTTTQVYDGTSGVLDGLSNNGNATANLATLSYTSNALVGSINYLDSQGNALASAQLGYDGDLRLASASATWQNGSGTFFSQSRSYDGASNVTSLATTLAAVPGQTGSGGSETQNFCYDEQNRLVWAGNSGTQPGAGSGTCGSGTLNVTGGLSAYSNSFVYTHLGELLKGPLNGAGTYKYLYCTSGTHQLTGLFPTGSGATCTNQTGALYTSSYDTWGNVTARTISGGTSAILSYDKLDHFVEWTGSNPTSQEWYAYDASGNRVLRRSTSGGSTSITVYAFGTEEHLYSGTGTLQGNTYYYSLGGQLIGELTGQPANKTSFFLTDGLGSVVATFSNTAGSAALLGNQVYGPYGTSRYTKGALGTNKGFTGQYNDSVTGLDYYNSRYYDPVVGVFLSADKKQGNLQGMNPYDYVGGNPETHNDPTGQMLVGPVGSGTWAQSSTSGGMLIHTTDYLGGQTQYYTAAQLRLPWYDPNTDTSNSTSAKIGRDTGWTAFMQVWNNPNASWGEKVSAFGGMIGQDINNLLILSMIFSGPEGDVGMEGGNLLLHGGEDLLKQGGEDLLKELVDACGGGLSFSATTKVATQHGEQAIGTMQVGEKVWAYNPKTRKMELEPVLHVWINHDNDLVNLTLTATKTSETLHTNKKHPFLTKEKGFLPVSQISLGMHVLRADGAYGVVTGWKAMPGTNVMYNLEVAQDHTFTVGDGQWVVHNCGGDLLNTGKTTLYRAVDAPELNDVLHYGDYGLSPHGGGKYFSFSEEGANQFAESSFNAGRRMTVTSVDVSNSILEKGYSFFDTGGGNASIHFDDEVLLELYSKMDLPKIINAPWVPLIGQ